MKRRAAPLLVAIVLLAALYARADWRRVVQSAAQLESRLLLAAMALFVPQTIVSAWRWGALIRAERRQPLPESLRQVLAASALNLLLPAKTGDLTKAAMVGGHVPMGWLATRAVAEKLADALALASLGALGLVAVYTNGLATGLFAWGLLGLGAAFWLPVARELHCGTRWMAAALWAAQTNLLWCLHLCQIQLFLWAAGVKVTLAVAAPKVALSLFVGLVPVSLFGMGTRDAALAYLFADAAGPAPLAVVGLLTSLRYVLPGLAGIAVVGSYLPSEQRAAADDQLASTPDPRACGAGDATGEVPSWVGSPLVGSARGPD